MYLPTQLFLYKPIFMTELLLAEALFAVKLKKRRGAWWRILLSVIFSYGVSFALPIVSYNWLWCSILFIVMYSVTCLAMWFCFDETLINIFFCSIAGYTVQHIAFEMYNFTSTLFNLGTEGGIYSDMIAETVYLPFSAPQSMLLYLCVFVIIYWASYLAFARRIKKNGDMQLKSKNILLFLAVIVLVDVVLSACVTYYSYQHADDFYSAMLSVFNIMVCLLAIIYQFELPIRKGLEKQLNVAYELLEVERKQYFTVKNNIELINQYCHDLKYKIRQIRDGGDVGDISLREIEDAVSIYGAAVRTGNSALDTILMEKSLFCYRNGINLSCIADGKSMSFMMDADIYVLFGNAIDNAIEAVTNLSDDKKVIGISVKRIREFLVVNIHNYFAGTIIMESGMPKTSKEDKLAHGYGISSMQAICDKYGGDMVIKAEDGVFNLNMMFPLSENIN